MYYQRSRDMLLGVCARLSEKSGLPVLLVRIIAIVLFFTIGPLAMSLLYLGLAILLPRS